MIIQIIFYIITVNIQQPQNLLRTFTAVLRLFWIWLLRRKMSDWGDMKSRPPAAQSLMSMLYVEGVW